MLFDNIKMKSRYLQIILKLIFEFKIFLIIFYRAYVFKGFFNPKSKLGKYLWKTLKCFFI